MFLAVKTEDISKHYSSQCLNDPSGHWLSSTRRAEIGLCLSANIRDLLDHRTSSTENDWTLWSYNNSPALLTFHSSAVVHPWIDCSPQHHSAGRLKQQHNCWWEYAIKSSCFWWCIQVWIHKDQTDVWRRGHLLQVTRKDDYQTETM